MTQQQMDDRRRQQAEARLVARGGLRALWLPLAACGGDPGAMGQLTERGLACAGCGRLLVRVGHSLLHPGSPVLAELAREVAA